MSNARDISAMEEAQLVKAFVNINQSSSANGELLMRDSYNITSITDDQTGFLFVNFEYGVFDDGDWTMTCCGKLQQQLGSATPHIALQTSSSYTNAATSDLARIICTSSATNTLTDLGAVWLVFYHT